MTSPDVHSPIQLQPEEIFEDRRSGYAYWMNLPVNAQSFTEAVPNLRHYGGYTELPTIVDVLGEHGSVLLVGEPGSGKSHLVRDMQVDTVVNSVPSFCLTVHVNASKRNGLENIAPQLSQFREAAKTAGNGLLILDNVDFLGYHGHHRRAGIAAEYASKFNEFLNEVMQDNAVKILATSHDDVWRKGQWTWNRPEIDEPAHEVLNAFQNRLVFEGRMALDSLVQILFANNRGKDEANPGVSIGQATRVMRELDKQGRADFFHANHLNIAQFLENPAEAISEIDKGRDERRNRSRGE